jgi:2-methylisocitrate lyase-like PEP mutase family enzyme
VAPKECGHIEGKQVVSASEMVEKVHATVEARRSEDFVIIARTDARGVEGIDEALIGPAATAKPEQTCCLWRHPRPRRKPPP